MTFGCGGKHTPVPVQGVVSLDGKPVVAATVHFLAEGGDGEGRPAFGTTDSGGTFRLSTLGQNDGALPRTYRVVVFKYVPARPDVKIPQFPNTAEGRAQREEFLYKIYGDQPHTKNVLPAKYGDLNSTPFRVSVPTKGQVVLALESK
jgi:hypothetical protein